MNGRRNRRQLASTRLRESIPFSGATDGRPENGEAGEANRFSCAQRQYPRNSPNLRADGLLRFASIQKGHDVRPFCLHLQMVGERYRLCGGESDCSPFSRVEPLEHPQTVRILQAESLRKYKVDTFLTREFVILIPNDFFDRTFPGSSRTFWRGKAPGRSPRLSKSKSAHFLCRCRNSKSTESLAAMVRRMRI